MLNLYHSLPYPMRVLLASARGYQYRVKRYGLGSEDRVQQTLDRDHWTREQWSRWQEERLAELLHRAATVVPWYRAIWQRRRAEGDHRSWEVLENWPILEKDQFRANGRMFVADDLDIRKLDHVTTSGTTGSPSDVWMSAETKRTWYAQFEARCRRWHGLSRHDRWAHLGGKMVAPLGATEPPFWVWNQGLKQLYLSSYHLVPGKIHHYARAMREHRVKYLLGYSSALYEIARGCLSEGIRDLKLEAAISDAEQVYPHHRKAVREAFGCELRQSYGMVEIAAAGSECEHGTFHLWPDTGLMEVVHGDELAAPGEIGDFVCTGLVNGDMPLIRFRVGDRGAIDDDGATCECGRTLPRIREIEGRISDMLITMDGRRLAPANVECIYDEQHPIREGQLIQHALDRVTLRYVPMPEFNEAAEAKLRRAVTNLLGPVDITMEPMTRLPRGANGKLRAVICAVPAEERDTLRHTATQTQR